MIDYPTMNRVALQIGPIKIFWYGILYAVSFLIGWRLILYRAKKFNLPWTRDQVADLIFYIALGVVLGGRLGYMLFYDYAAFIHAPWLIIRIWEGGMSFHGGLLGVVIAVLLFGKKHRHTFFEIMDLIAPIVPLGLAAGRLGNFINAELMGRITTMPWGMIYPDGGPFPRHPSPLYELFFEGIVLFILLWTYASKPRPPMAVSGFFAIFYGIFRFSCEFFRQPDYQLGFIAFGWLTMGQLLSIPLIIAGLMMLKYAYRTKRPTPHRSRMKHK
ncbi:MAG: prolipoprotein diacylglyceryl transferase [Gammaproteobacteria bacterium GWF2_41_13]|nr:MAG: prolipoprotein diacylglyceryl transferase [Gammaproteobacteria bacterium GWF2_41_13]